MIALLAQIPNFAGFILLALFLYKALMQSMENNRYLADKLMNCYNRPDVPENSTNDK